ncbi:MAG: hypothetical protein LLF95_06580 [Bacteroidales bacterium]|nr:hypothetical protein [Bacteroidales bacterium]
MRILNKNSHIYILTLLLGSLFSFTACSTDEETEIVPKTLEEYKTEMSQFVSSEKIKVENCVVGYNKGDFKSTTNFDAYRANYLTVLVSAEAVLAKPDVTIADIVNANKTLAVPGKNFTSSLWISDRRPLNDLIISAETLNAATTVGTEAGQVSETAKNDFTTAITAAKAVRGASTTIERQVLEAIEKLKSAENTFKSAIIK